jgi:hypothetical protein
VAKTKAKSQKGRGAAASAAKTTAPKTAKPNSTSATPIVPEGPPPPPAPPPPRDELPAPRDVARLLRYGERFGGSKIDVRMLPLQLPASSGGLALFDPGVPGSWRAFDRRAGTGQFRVMLSVARSEAGAERLAAIVIHVGRPPIARWTVAHYGGQNKPKSPDQLPRCAVTTGWIALLDAGQGSPGVIAVPAQTGIQPVEIPLTDGRRTLALPCGNGEFAAYWAVDAADKPVCLVVDFDVFTQKEWKARPPTV